MIFVSVLFELEYRGRLNGIKSKQNHTVEGLGRPLFQFNICTPYRHVRGSQSEVVALLRKDKQRFRLFTSSPTLRCLSSFCFARTAIVRLSCGIFIACSP